MNAYKVKLQRELAELTRRRVALREALKRIAGGWRCGDDTDMRQTIDRLQRDLKSTDLPYARLCTELGQEHRLIGSVSLRLSAAERAVLARHPPDQVPRSSCGTGASRSKVTSPRGRTCRVI
jgi:hypothetical protein